jgi:hypothetical protein
VSLLVVTQRSGDANASAQPANADLVVLLVRAHQYADAIALARLCDIDIAPVSGDGVRDCGGVDLGLVKVVDALVDASLTPPKLLAQSTAQYDVDWRRDDDDGSDDESDAPCVSTSAAAMRTLRRYLAAFDGARTNDALAVRAATRFLVADAGAALPHWLAARLMVRDNVCVLCCLMTCAAATQCGGVVANLSDACKR